MLRARLAELRDAVDLGTFQALSNPFSNLSKLLPNLRIDWIFPNYQSQVESGRIRLKEKLAGTVWAQ
jgi:ABC-type uncharacterized transport system YnjBCD ATPase subunit